MSTIYTIGYGNREMNDFLDLLKQYDIEYVIDVRTAPYSKFNPEFSRAPLERRLKDRGMKYDFWGDTLGGRPSDPDCFTDDGKIDYDAIEQKEFYKSGIKRLEKASIEGFRVAIMCSERKPEECHRSKLIGVTLTRQGIPVKHIDESGQELGQEDVINRVRKSLGLDQPQQMTLFGNPQDVVSKERALRTSRKAYAPTRSEDSD